MSVDLSKIKPGDLVAVNFYVTDINDHDVFLANCSDLGPQTDAPVSAIVSHTTKALSVGDRVKVGTYIGRIRAIHQGLAWVTADSLPGHDGRVARLTELERVDD